MNIAQIEKLRDSIKSSIILNEAEKQEWQQLLELMNDKQMLELEKILASSEGTAPLAGAQVSLRGEALSSKQSISQPSAAPLPPLSHIINLPQAEISKSQFPFSHLKEPGIVKPPASAGKVQKSYQEVSSPSSSREKVGIGGGFWQKIKDVLAEKELPAGHPEPVKELELPSPTSKQVNIPSHPRGTPNLPLANLGSPRPPLILRGEEKSLPPLNVRGGGGGDMLKVPVPLAKRTQPASSTEITAKIAKAILARKPETREEFELSGQTTGIKSTIQPGQVAGADLSKKRAATEIPSKLQSLSDLAQLKPDDFDEDSFSSLVKKIKTLVSSFNYHQVMFNLEKSPLYKAYVNTGIQVLSQKGDFGQLIQKKPQELLSQGEFERFADLLMEIQTG